MVTRGYTCHGRCYGRCLKQRILYLSVFRAVDGRCCDFCILFVLTVNQNQYRSPIQVSHLLNAWKQLRYLMATSTLLDNNKCSGRKLQFVFNFSYQRDYFLNFFRIFAAKIENNTIATCWFFKNV